MGMGHSGVQGWGAATGQSVCGHYNSSGGVMPPAEAVAPYFASRLSRRRIPRCFLMCMCSFDFQEDGLGPITNGFLNKEMN